MKIIEHRRLIADKLHACCIKQAWYSYGTNDEYAAMLARADGDSATFGAQNLYEIARDICEHTFYPNYCNDNHNIKNIMYLVAKYCYESTFEIIDESQERTST